MPIIAPIPRNERRQMQKIVQKTRDKDYARRLTAMLMLHEGSPVSRVAKTLCAARSSVGRWISWFTEYGSEGLKSLPVGCPKRWLSQEIMNILPLLLTHSPQHFGWLRTRWSAELLALQINKIFNINISISTVYRYLRKTGIVWRRAAPTLKCVDPNYEEKVAMMQVALASTSPDHPVFYEVEVDIDLNPKIGADWCLKGQQKRVVTPGQNRKHYLARCLHASTGKVHYVSGERKNSKLFIKMLDKLRSTYRRAKTLTLLLDNYVIHKSRKVEQWLTANFRPTATVMSMRLLRIFEL